MNDHSQTGIGMTSQRTRDRLARRLASSGIHHEQVLTAMANVPRHLFVDEALAHRAYEDTALPIGSGQTISQPYVVALMTQTLLNEPRQRILELGTGSGYQAAILSRIVTKVFSVERYRSLHQRADELLRSLKYRNVRCLHADGFGGWPEQGPFDGIIVTAAPASLPEALFDQLEVGGRLVAPVGGDESQELWAIDRTRTGYVEQVIERVRFVPLLSGLVRA